MKGYTERGNVKQNSEYQIKKHYTDMSVEDKKIISDYLNSVDKISRSHHFKERFNDEKIGITLNDVLMNIKRKDIFKNIIEYNETYVSKYDRIEQRVLIKLYNIYNVHLDGRNRPEQCFGFIVFNLTNNQILTGYYNSTMDRHQNLNKYRYNNNLEVRPIKKGGYSKKEKQNIFSNEMHHRYHSHYDRQKTKRKTF